MKVRAALTSAPAWAVVSTAAVLVAFLVYDSVDRKPPSVTVTELHADTALSTRTLTLTIECDEPCWLASANIGRETVDNVGETPSWLNTDLLATPANNFASNYVHRTKTVVLSLAAPQADWLLKQFHADVAAGLQSVLDRLAVALDFVDGSGNANRVLLFLEQ